VSLFIVPAKIQKYQLSCSYVYLRTLKKYPLISHKTLLFLLFLGVYTEFCFHFAIILAFLGRALLRNKRETHNICVLLCVLLNNQHETKENGIMEMFLKRIIFRLFCCCCCWFFFARVLFVLSNEIKQP
jgi:hypothetical protein